MLSRGNETLNANMVRYRSVMRPGRQRREKSRERKRDMMKVFVITAILTLLTATASVSAAVVAKGEGVVVTTEDMAAMRKIAPPFFTPTKEALLRATIRTVLFAKQADLQEVSCEEAYGKDGFEYTFALSRCYLRQRLKKEGLMPGAAESYYRAHRGLFLDADGKQMPFDKTLERRIRIKILTAKAPIVRLKEYERLFKAYKVEICGDSGC